MGQYGLIIRTGGSTKTIEFKPQQDMVEGGERLNKFREKIGICTKVFTNNERDVCDTKNGLIIFPHVVFWITTIVLLTKIYMNKKQRKSYYNYKNTEIKIIERE